MKLTSGNLRVKKNSLGEEHYSKDPFVGITKPEMFINNVQNLLNDVENSYCFYLYAYGTFKLD